VDKLVWQTLVDGGRWQMDAPRPASNDFWDLVAPLPVSSSDREALLRRLRDALR
jgi:hypothetical protein